MLGEEGGDVLARPVGGVAGEEEFAHGCVDEARAGRAAEEAPDRFLRFLLPRPFPAVGRIVAEALDAKQPVAELAGAQTHVVAPQQLEAHGGGAGVFALGVTLGVAAEGRGAVFEVQQVLVGLAGGDAAEGEPGGEFGAEVEAEETVAGVFVGGHAAGGDEVAEPVVAAGFAAVEGVRGFGVCGPFGRVREAEGGVQRFEESDDDVV